MSGVTPYICLTQAAAKISQLEQHVQQLQSAASIAGALEYRCQGLHQDKQQLTQQLQQLKGKLDTTVCACQLKSEVQASTYSVARPGLCQAEHDLASRADYYLLLQVV